MAPIFSNPKTAVAIADLVDHIQTVLLAIEVCETDQELLETITRLETAYQQKVLMYSLKKAKPNVNVSASS
jgi:hypothetical protein